MCSFPSLFPSFLRKTSISFLRNEENLFRKDSNVLLTRNTNIFSFFGNETIEHVGAPARAISSLSAERDCSEDRNESTEQTDWLPVEVVTSDERLSSHVKGKWENAEYMSAETFAGPFDESGGGGSDDDDDDDEDGTSPLVIDLAVVRAKHTSSGASRTSRRLNERKLLISFRLF